MSTDGKAALIQTVGHLVMRFQDGSQRFDAEVGRLYGLNPAELHCLSFLWPGPQQASAIAREVRLTPAAVTALIDRLERRGYVARRRDASDRRKVLVAPTEKTSALVAATYARIGDAGNAMLAQFSEEELGLLAKFLQKSVALQDEAIVSLTRTQGTRRPSG